MKILHILSTPRAEGTPNLVLDWLATGKHEQEVFVLNSQPADLTERLKSAAHWYGECDYFSHGKRKFTDIAKGIYRICRERKPDLVICWPTGFANWACLGARLAGVKALLVYGGNPPRRGFRGDWMTRYGLWPLVALGAKCLCCSDYVRDKYREVPLIPRSLLQTVWNSTRAGLVSERATRSRQGRESGQDRCTALMVATLEAHKDHATLFRAIPAIRDALPDFRLLLAGEGSLRKELEALVADLGVTESVEFLGMRRDVPELLGQADVFVFSTTPQEGLGSVLLEAMAAGLPIVASDVPACREVLKDGTYGLLVPPADPRTLANAVVETLREGANEPELAEARDFALSFTAERMMAQYLAYAGFTPEP
jgi:glycosyltransferase involved in cell wall biosynthesis